MRVLMLSKACVVGAYQRKLEAIAALGVELTVAVPPEWRDERGVLTLERAHTDGYTLAVTPIWFNGSYHLHVYPRFGELVARVRPDVVHIDEEPYNLATWHALRLAQRHGARTLFFSWQNLLRRYPPPFSWLEREVLARAEAGIVGNRAAVDVWRAKGYRGPLHIIPQFGVDPDIFTPRGRPTDGAGPTGFTVGYAGRLVPEKGVDVLLLALAQAPGVRLRIVGAGPERALLSDLVRRYGLGDRVSLEPMIPSTRMPALLAELDALVLPSRSRPNWKEQFGRVLIEAMACAVPVIASDCGELPNVIGDAGLVFPEDDVEALAAHLRALRDDAARRVALGARGRAHVLAHYTQQGVAERTVAVYRELTAVQPARLPQSSLSNS
jgi:glycosyltransferase involved in cell wall biosynthesis